MFNKLRTRIILIMLSGTIFSIILVSLITNLTLFNKFNNYLTIEQKNRVKEVIEIIEHFYSMDNSWDEKNLNELENTKVLDSFDITIKNNKGRIVFIHNSKTDVNMHTDMMKKMGMMDRMHNNMMGRMHNSMEDNKNYESSIHNLEVNGEIIGSVKIGYYGPFNVNKRDIIFTNDIKRSIIIGAIISSIVAILLGTYFSKLISSPIVNITKVSNNLRNGNLDARIKQNNNIKELKELSDSINHLAISLKKQKDLRKRLTSDISHELRTPLTVLQNQIEALVDGVFPTTKKRLTIIKSEVNRLINLIGQLKYLTAIENHKSYLDKEKFNISKLIEEVIDGFKYQFKNKSINLNYHIKKDIYINGDKNKIRQVLLNIISNAYKFSFTEGTVNITLNEDIKDIIIKIKDNGIGIDKKDLPFVFERLYRAEKSRNRKTGGVGIGLTITKEIIDKHKGYISVESQKDKGTIFTIKLPKNT
ncbi:MAG: HAMP domain-containing histidine kinase [Firmicutes bacterium]|nr:HAMP domain-containing histidine kinase [Bacillota bacterium]